MKTLKIQIYKDELQNTHTKIDSTSSPLDLMELYQVYKHIEQVLLKSGFDFSKVNYNVITEDRRK